MDQRVSVSILHYYNQNSKQRNSSFLESTMIPLQFFLIQRYAYKNRILDVIRMFPNDSCITEVLIVISQTLI